MEKKIFKQAGVLSVLGSRYAVLLISDGSVPFSLEANLLKNDCRIPFFNVAKEFSIDVTNEGIVSIETVYTTPHKMSISGDFVVEWLPEAKDIEVLIPNAGEVIN